MKLPTKFYIGGAVLFSLVIAVGYFLHARNQQLIEKEIRQNCHYIQLSMERYAIDNELEFYPCADWVGKYMIPEYLSFYPENRWGKESPFVPDGVKRMVKVDPDATEGFAGNFSYITFLTVDGNAVRYEIRGYGKPPYKGASAEESIIISLDNPYYPIIWPDHLKERRQEPDPPVMDW